MFNIILDIITNQKLHESCTSETSDMNTVFYKLTAVESINASIEYIHQTEIVKNFPIMFIEYNEVDDEFVLRIKRYNKNDGIVSEIEETDTAVKWTPTFKNQYVLTYSFGSKVGETFKNKLPVIIKNK